MLIPERGGRAGPPREPSAPGCPAPKSRRGRWAQGSVIFFPARPDSPSGGEGATWTVDSLSGNGEAGAYPDSLRPRPRRSPTGEAGGNTRGAGGSCAGEHGYSGGQGCAGSPGPGCSGEENGLGALKYPLPFRTIGPQEAQQTPGGYRRPVQSLQGCSRLGCGLKKDSSRGEGRWTEARRGWGNAGRARGDDAG